MDALTPAERRGALVVVLLLALGAAHDLWQASRPLPAPPFPDAAARRPPASGAPYLSVPADSAGDPGAGGEERRHRAEPILDLNRASARELESLPGVGPVLAGRIIDHRLRHGPFRDADELLAVRGIGRRLLERLRPRVTVGPGASPAATPGPVQPRRGG